MASPEEIRAFFLSLLTLGIGGLFLVLIYFLLRRPRSSLLEENLLQQTRRLAESESRFRILFEHGGAGLALLSADGSIVEANPALEEMLGYGRGELVGLRISDLSHPDDRSDYTAPNSGAARFARRRPHQARKALPRRDGGLIWRGWLGPSCATTTGRCATTPVC